MGHRTWLLPAMILSAAGGWGVAGMRGGKVGQERAPVEEVVAERFVVRDKAGQRRLVLDSERGVEMFTANGSSILRIWEESGADGIAAVIELGLGTRGKEVETGAIPPIREMRLMVRKGVPRVLLQTEKNRVEVSMDGVREVPLDGRK